MVLLTVHKHRIIAFLLLHLIELNQGIQICDFQWTIQLFSIFEVLNAFKFINDILRCVDGPQVLDQVPLLGLGGDLLTAQHFAKSGIGITGLQHLLQFLFLLEVLVDFEARDEAQLVSVVILERDAASIAGEVLELKFLSQGNFLGLRRLIKLVRSLKIWLDFLKFLVIFLFCQVISADLLKLVFWWQSLMLYVLLWKCLAFDLPKVKHRIQIIIFQIFL